MGAGEWIALVAIVVTVCLTVAGSAGAVIVEMASLKTTVKHLAETLAEFKHSVDDEHREMWRAINRRHRAEGNSE